MKTFKDIPNRTFIFIFSAHCIVLFPLRTPASWRSAKCTRRVLKVWSHWPNSKLICYSERGAPRLLFGYKFVDLPWKLLKIYPTVHSYLLFFLHTVLYCFHWEHRQVEGVLSAHGGSLRRVHTEGLWSHWPNSKLICYSERGAPRLSFGYKFVDLPWQLLKIYPTEHSYFFLHTVLYCFHWEHRQVEGVLSAHGGSLRYEAIGQIQNWYVILKGEHLGFHLDISLSTPLKNF